MIQEDQTIPLSCKIFVGPNCDVEYQNENGEVSTKERGRERDREGRREREREGEVQYNVGRGWIMKGTIFLWISCSFCGVDVKVCG